MKFKKKFILLLSTFKKFISFAPELGLKSILDEL